MVTFIFFFQKCQITGQLYWSSCPANIPLRNITKTHAYLLEVGKGHIPQHIWIIFSICSPFFLIYLPITFCVSLIKCLSTTNIKRFSTTQNEYFCFVFLGFRTLHHRGTHGWNIFLPYQQSSRQHRSQYPNLIHPAEPTPSPLTAM